MLCIQSTRAPAYTAPGGLVAGAGLTRVRGAAASPPLGLGHARVVPAHHPGGPAAPQARARRVRQDRGGQHRAARAAPRTLARIMLNTVVLVCSRLGFHIARFYRKTYYDLR